MKTHNCPECGKEIQITNEQIRHKLKCPHCGEDLIWDIITEKEYKLHMLVVYLTLGGALLIGLLIFLIRNVFQS